MYRLFFVFLCLYTGFTLAQHPIDTSFSIFSDSIKVSAKYPFIRIAAIYGDSSYSTVFGIPYKHIPRNLVLDIFQPINGNNNKLPAVLLVHGGGWRSGSRSMEYPMAAAFATAGFVAITLEYRLSPESLYPAAVEDIAAALAYISGHASQLRIDTSRIALYGCSSGGHLAALSAQLVNKHDVFAGNLSVKAVIDIDGVLDLTDPAESGKDSILTKPSAAKQWLGATYKQNPLLWRSASAINHIGQYSPAMLFINSSIPRFHAGRDSVISILRSFNIHTQVVTFPDTPHTFWLYQPWSEDVQRTAIAFLRKLYHLDSK